MLMIVRHAILLMSIGVQWRGLGMSCDGSAATWGEANIRRADEHRGAHADDTVAGLYHKTYGIHIPSIISYNAAARRLARRKKQKGKSLTLTKDSKAFSNVLEQNKILTGCNSKTRSIVRSRWGETMSPHATPVGWLSEHCAALISLTAQGMERGLRPQNRCNLIGCLRSISCPAATFYGLHQVSFLYPRDPLWCSEDRAEAQ